MKKMTYYSTNGVLAGAVLYFAWSLSRSGRSVIDWAVLALATSAVLYNLSRLGHRLYAADGAAAVWHLLRTLLFWVVGLLNTLFRPPEDPASWQYVLGWLFIALAAADSVALHLRERKIQRAGPQAQ